VSKCFIFIKKLRKSQLGIRPQTPVSLRRLRASPPDLNINLVLSHVSNTHKSSMEGEFTYFLVIKGECEGFGGKAPRGKRVWYRSPQR